MSYTNPEDDPNWSYTTASADVVFRRQTREKQNGLEARHAIHRDSVIDGGVYEGLYGGEAIVVDSDKYPDGISQAMDTVLSRITKSDGSVDKGLVLGAVFDVVTASMRYDAAAVEDIFQRHGKGRDGVKLQLNEYISEGVGVCRHQALFAGLLLEMLQKRGLIRGRASVERNMMKDPNDKDRYDGHSWVRYTNGAGDVWIVDVAQKRIQKLDDLMQARENGDAAIWDYARPEDARNFRERIALGAKGLSLPQHDYPESSYTDGNGVITKLPWN